MTFLQQSQCVRPCGTTGGTTGGTAPSRNRKSVVNSERSNTSFAPAHVVCLELSGRTSRDERNRRWRTARAAARKTDAYREARGQGLVVDEVTDDGLVMAFFAPARVALSCAIQTVDALLSRGETRLRVGVHRGPVRRAESVSDTTHIEGPGASLAWDVMACGDDGHVLLSETTVTPSADLAPWADALSDVGVVEVRPGLSMRLFSLVHGDVGHPSTPTRVAQLAPRAGRDPIHALPAYRGRFVGRESDISGVMSQLDTDRLAVLTGPPGIGKTRLAVEVAERCATTVEDGLWFVDLSAVPRAEDVGWAIAVSLGLAEVAAELPIDRAARRLRDHGAILILNACDGSDPRAGVAKAASDCIRLLLDRCPRLRILATGAAPFDDALGGGRQVRGFSTPQPGSEADSDAVELFERAAYEADRGFRTTGKQAATVAAICACVAGSPLGIVVAARGTVLGSVETTLAALRLRDASARGLTRAIAWAYDALTKAERTSLRRVSVFSASFTSAAASAACDVDESTVAGRLAAMLARGLIVESPDTVGHCVPAAVRAYVTSRREAVGVSDTVSRRVAEYFAEPPLDARPPALRQWERADAERALTWAATNDIALAYRLMARLSSRWHDGGEWSLSDRWHGALLAKREGVAVASLATALTARSRARLELGDTDGALQDAEEGLAHASSMGDREGVALARRARGQALVAAGSIEEGMRQYEEALAILRRLERHAEAGSTAAELAAGSLLVGDAQKAMAYSAQGLRLCAGDDAASVESALILLRAIASVRLGQYARATGALGDALTLHRRVGAVRHEASCLLWQATVAARESDHYSAALYGIQRLRVVERIGSAGDIADALRAVTVSSRRAGTLAAAREFCRQESSLRRQLGHRTEGLRAGLLRANVEIAAGRASRARDAVADVLSQDPDGVEAGLCVEGLGVAAGLSGLHEEAATLLAAAAKWRAGNDTSDVGDIAILSSEVAAGARAELRRIMLPERVARATANGEGMTLAQATAYGRARLAV